MRRLLIPAALATAQTAIAREAPVVSFAAGAGGGEADAAIDRITPLGAGQGAFDDEADHALGYAFEVGAARPLRDTIEIGLCARVEAGEEDGIVVSEINRGAPVRFRETGLAAGGRRVASK